MKNYKYISGVSKLCIFVMAVSIYFFPIATYTDSILGQNLDISLYNTKIKMSTYGWLTGGEDLTEEVLYTQLFSDYTGKPIDKVPDYATVPIYLNMKIPMFADIWLFLIVFLGISLFFSQNRFVALASGAILLYYAVITVYTFEIIRLTVQNISFSSLITGIPIDMNGSTYIFKLGYGVYCAVISACIVIKDNFPSRFKIRW
ncbi:MULTISPECIES: hypothetical protein [Methanosarcina]|nr:MULTISPECIES: hypothetical protein [Methanosarcina]AKB41221.1 hypothetical protein MSMAW_2230 [Methanosarcina mazei WWM610]AKB69488.1 hypothetical protein MSMAL_2945 [Methanosarcina mazei LYC]WIM42495.1 hypothetical protein PSF70_13435 [Methanosarcina mazei]WIM45954.1 hypothetical protein PQQ20_13330 [Methanosarcina mazei]